MSSYVMYSTRINRQSLCDLLFVLSPPPPPPSSCRILWECWWSGGGKGKGIEGFLRVQKSFQEFEKFWSSALGGAVGEVENCIFFGKK